MEETLTSEFAFDGLLQPISAEQPAGQDIRTDPSHDSLYFRIKDARNAARAAERQLDYGDDGVTPPHTAWQTVLTLSQQVLCETSKDLEVAAYLIEALIRERGFGGLSDGFRLVRELVQRYWDDLYPRPDEDGPTTRVTHLIGLNGVENKGTLVRPILMSPLTSGASVPSCSCADFQQAQPLEKLDDAERARRVADGAASMDAIQRSLAETSVEFLQTRQQEIQFCLDEYNAMCAALDEQCSELSLHSSHIRNALESCAESVVYLIAARGGDKSAGIELDPDVIPQLAETGPSWSALEDLAAGSPVGTFQSRDEALATLAAVAEYFRQTEPHSPLSYAAAQLVRWGQMPLPELVKELIPDDQARSHFFTIVGMHEPPPG